jgi:hypothetical protein
MSVHLFQTIWKGPSGLPTDQFVNNWHFDSIGAATDFDNVRDMLEDFYATGTSGTSVVGGFSPLLNHTCQIKAYNLEHDKPRAPVYASSFTTNLFGGGLSLPFECAVCFSFETRRESGVLQARRRNRVYLGPLATSTVDATGRVVATYRTNVINAGKALHDAALAATAWDWKVWSGTDNSDHPVDHLWIDDAFDTQRRRGLTATGRTEHTY